MPLLKVSGLSFSYGDRPLLKDISFEVRPGEFLCVLGPNGSGKSTLLKLLTGFLKTRPGEVRLGGQDVSSLAAGRLARLAAYVPSETSTPYDFTVREIVLLGRAARAGLWRPYGAEDTRAGDLAMEETGITALSPRSVNTLSTGERQLVFIAQALAQQARLLLLDEPTSHLDLKYKSDIMALLLRLAGKGMAVAAVLHEPALARLGCSKALLLGRDGAYACGPAARMLTRARLAAVYALPEN